MRTIAILPVKTFDAAKQRLSARLAGGARRALAQAMFADVLTSLSHVDGVDAIAVVTADRIAESAALATGALVLHDPEESGQSAAAAIGVEHALSVGFDRALMVPGDTPLLDPAELSQMLGRAEREELGLVVVPDRHGSGTNALLLAPPDAIAPSFGPGSRERHEQAAAAAGVSSSIEPLPSLVLDVDTPEDLTALGGRLDDVHGQASRTRGALVQLDRVRTRVST
jgi:2-phospho-L-lactate/phosphoenolpyruvate guanylyltransferase